MVDNPTFAYYQQKAQEKTDTLSTEDLELALSRELLEKGESKETPLFEERSEDVSDDQIEKRSQEGG